MRLPITLILAAFFVGCDGGLAPPDERGPGAIRGIVEYVHPESWPPPDSLVDLRFVAMRFVPQDTADFLQLNRLVFSAGLRRYVARDTFVIGDVDPGAFVYSGVAQQFSPNLFDWRPVGLYEDAAGIFTVVPGETTFVSVQVDFYDRPPFPPPSSP